jgi:acyl carrier protein
MENTINRLKKIIVQDLDVNIKESEIRNDVSLYEGGLALDSIAIVDLIIQIEKEFAFRFEDKELNTDLFNNLGSLATFIDVKLAKSDVC